MVGGRSKAEWVERLEYVFWKGLRSLLREFYEYAVRISIVKDVNSASGRQGFGQAFTVK